MSNLPQKNEGLSLDLPIKLGSASWSYNTNDLISEIGGRDKKLWKLMAKQQPKSWNVEPKVWEV